MGLELIEEQECRLKAQYPAAYVEYLSVTGRNLVQPMIEDIISRYPAAPKLPSVYITAGKSKYWDSVIHYDGWTGAGNTRRKSVACARIVGALYILHYVENIFDVGICLEDYVVDTFLECLTQHRETCVRKTDLLTGDIAAYRFEAANGGCIIYVNGIRVMLLDSDMCDVVSSMFADNVYTPALFVSRVLENLKS